MDRDLITQTTMLPAPRDRVWAAIADSARFGAWFGAAFDGAFVAGQEACGRIVPTQVDPDVARLQEPHRGTPLRIVVETIEPGRRFAFRWHPFAIDPTRDHAAEPMTLVLFVLDDAAAGTLLTITEAGFAALDPDRREPAFEANSGGWAHQARLLAAYLARPDAV